MKWILGEHMFDVGHEQFLVLLFVMDPERDNWFHFREPFFVGARQ